MATVAFGPVEIAFDADVLEPRQWTLEQARWAVELSPSLPDGRVLELCCGAGQIGLVVAVETGRPIVQVDDDEAACAYARRNAETAGVESDVRCRQIEDAADEGEQFVVVLADPPYVPSAATAGYEGDPTHAIDGGPDGLALATRCVEVAARVVAPGGVVLVQVGGAAQAAALAARAAAVGLAEHETRVFGDDRAVLLLRPG